MEIKYDNGFNKIIQEHETDLHDYYSKIFIKNDRTVKQEYYLNKKLKKQSIFTNEYESRESLIEKYCSLGIITQIGERAFIDGFKHEKFFIFDELGKQVEITNYIYDEGNNCICKSHTNDFIEETPVWEDTRKYYVDKSIRTQGDLFECHFDETGKLIPIEIDIEELELGDHAGTWIDNNEAGIEDLVKIFGMTRKLAAFYVSSEIFPWETLSGTK